MAKRNADRKERIVRGSGNVFADLGYRDAEERQTRLRLAHALNGVIARSGLTQTEVAAKLGIGQPKISALANYKLDGFSVERLMIFLTTLEQDVRITVGPRRRAPARISVVAEGRRSPLGSAKHGVERARAIGR